MNLGWLATVGALQTLGWSLLHSLWQSAIVAAGLAVFLWAVPSARTELRSRAAGGAVLAGLLFFVLTATTLLVDWRAHVRCWEMSAEAGAVPAAELPAEVPPSCASHGVDVAASPVVEPPKYRAILAWLPELPGLDSRGLREPALLATSATAALGFVWLGILGAMVARGLQLRRSLRRIVRSAEPVSDPGATVALKRLETALGVAGPVALLESDRVASPAVTGWWRPTLLFPPGLLETLRPAEREAILAHELAHVARGDVLVQGLVRAAEAVLWFNPALRWMAGRHRDEAEAACDLAALDATRVGRRAYGETLLVLEGFRGLRRAPGIALPLLGEDRLLTRIRRLRSGARPGRFRAVAVAGAGIALAVLLVLGSARAIFLSSWAVMARDVAARQS